MDKAPADALILAMGEANEPEIMVKAPRGEGDLFIKLNENNSTLHPKIENGKVTVTIQLYAKGVIVDNESDYGDRREEEILKLNDAVHRKIKEDIEEGVRLVQKNFMQTFLVWGVLSTDIYPRSGIKSRTDGMSSIRTFR